MEAWLDGLFLLPQFLIAFVLAAAMTEVLPRANAHWLVPCGIVLWGSLSLLLDNSVALLITTLWPDGEVFDLAHLY